MSLVSLSVVVDEDYVEPEDKEEEEDDDSNEK
jgi:hypothetical protein